jgi:hypothetical protein
VTDAAANMPAREAVAASRAVDSATPSSTAVSVGACRACPLVSPLTYSADVAFAHSAHRGQRNRRPAGRSPPRSRLAARHRIPYAA